MQEPPQLETNRLLLPHVPEGRTTIIEAPQRWGKTLFLVIDAYSNFIKGRRIFCNIQLSFPYEPLEFGGMRLSDGSSKFRGAHVAFDELNFLFDASSYHSKRNKAAAAFVLQQKKQGCNVVGTTHRLESLDLTIKENHDQLILPEVYPAWPKKPEVMRLTIESGPLQRYYSKKVPWFPIGGYLGMYDTFNTQDPFKSLAERKGDVFELP